MYERRMRRIGTALVALGGLAGLLALFLVTVCATALDQGQWSATDAAGPCVATVLVILAALVCRWRGRAYQRQARAGRPLARYALDTLASGGGKPEAATPASDGGKHETAALASDSGTPEAAAAGTPNVDGDLEYYDPARRDSRPVTFTLGPSSLEGVEVIGSGALLAIDGEAIADASASLDMGAYWNVDSLARRPLNIVLLETFLFAYEPGALSISEEGANPDNHDDADTRTGTQLYLDPERCFKIPYRDITEIRVAGRQFGLVLLRGTMGEGLELVLRDGSTVLLVPCREPGEHMSDALEHARSSLDHLMGETLRGTR